MRIHDEDEKPSGGKQNVPPGTHDFTIRSVTDDDTTMVVSLKHAKDGYWWVEQRMQHDSKIGRWLQSQLRQALSMDRDQWAATNPEDLVGLSVRAEITHNPGKTGDRVFVNVGKFLVPLPGTDRKPAARTAAAKVMAAGQGGDEDDIPF